MEAKVSVNCVHPGVVRTGLTRDKDRFFTGKWMMMECFFFFLSIIWFWWRLVWVIRSVLLPFVEDGEVNPAGCSNNVLRCNKSPSEWCIRQVLRRLQRGVYVEARYRRHWGVQTMDRVGSDGRWYLAVIKYVDARPPKCGQTKVTKLWNILEQYLKAHKRQSQWRQSFAFRLCTNQLQLLQHACLFAANVCRHHQLLFFSSLITLKLLI